MKPIAKFCHPVVVIIAALYACGAVGRAQVNAKIIGTVKIHESHSYGYFPSLQMLSSGELICDFSLDADKDEVETCFWGYVISDDKGKTWGMRNTEGAVFREAAYTRNPSLGDGSLFMVAGLPLASAGDDHNLTTSSVQFSDGGRTIRISRDVHISFPMAVASEKIDDPVTNVSSLGGEKIKSCARVAFSGTLVRAQDGGWLATMYGKMEGDRYYRTVIVCADQGGKNWKYVTTVADDRAAADSLLKERERKTEGFCEPRMVRLNDSRLLLVMRRGSNNLIYRCWSGDEGKTWSGLGSIGFRGVKPNLWLMRSGILALSTGRPGPVAVRFSLDGGESWTGPTALAPEERTGARQSVDRQKSTCYTGMVEVEPGRLLIVYDSLPFVGGWGLNPGHPAANNTILGTFVDVAK